MFPVSCLCYAGIGDTCSTVENLTVAGSLLITFGFVLIAAGSAFPPHLSLNCCFLHLTSGFRMAWRKR